MSIDVWLTARGPDGADVPFLVDRSKFDELSAFRWREDRGYIFRTQRASERRPSLGGWKHYKQYLGRQLLGLKKGNPLFADHINCDKRDNRLGNLRAITKHVSPQNTRATRRRSELLPRGVRRIGHRFQAQICHLGVRRYKTFSSVEAADAQYRDWRRLDHPYAMLGPPSAAEKIALAAGLAEDRHKLRSETAARATRPYKNRGNPQLPRGVLIRKRVHGISFWAVCAIGGRRRTFCYSTLEAAEAMSKEMRRQAQPFTVEGKMSEAERKAIEAAVSDRHRVRSEAAKLGRAKMTPEQRSESARKGAAARCAKPMPPLGLSASGSRA